MSQLGVASRPGTQQSMMGRLPEIKHPLSRMSNPNTLDVRGVSRSDNRPLSHMSDRSQMSARPLANEGNYQAGSRLRHSSAGRLQTSRGSVDRGSVFKYDAIPEGVAVTGGDPSKPRLPLFGSRAGDVPPSRNGSRLGSALSQSQERKLSSRLSNASAQGRLEIDELESLLKEKVKHGYYEIKKKFKDNDPEAKGNVSKDVMFRILVTTLGRPITTSQYNRLMERLCLKEKAVINYGDFFAHFREVTTQEYPRWMDPVHRNVQDKSYMSANQVHAHLREKAKQKVRDLADLIPQANPDGSGHILRGEFRNVLNRLGFYMEDTEFDKLWAKYDPECSNTINGEKMMKQLGVAIERNGSALTAMARQASAESGKESVRPMRKREEERQRSLDIERWLKNKFREGFISMRQAFEAADAPKSGMVSHEDFLKILNDNGLNLPKAALAEFLARCSVEPTKLEVPYREFLHRFQDRSETGMPHNILTNPKHRYNRADSPGGKSTMSALESQLLNMFQRDFLSLLGTFHKIDKLGMDIISQEEFRAAIESKFELEMSETQFRNLVDRVPLDEDGNVKYADFMSQFDTRGKAFSLFGELPAAKPYKSVGCLPRDPSPPPAVPESPPIPAEADRLVFPEPTQQPREEISDEAVNKRTTHELFKEIKDLLRKDYQKVETVFHDLDELNTGRISQEMMYQMMFKLDVRPEITRGEIRDLWKTFITNQDKTLDFLQFVRHFGYSLKSAAFPNAKVVPPRKGDSDFMIRSRKLNCAADMLQDNLRSKIDYMWEDLRQEFVSMDPYGTGHVTKEEFRDVLQELCVHLSNYELDMLTRKFQVQGDGRVSYVEFLKPFAMRKQVWRYGNNMLSLLQHPNAELPLADIVEPPQKGLTGVTAKLRQKLSGDWKNLRRAFKKLDTGNQGYLSVPEFRSVLKLANVILDEDEVYHVLSTFDENMTGKIQYNKFIDETFKAESRMSNPNLRKSASGVK